VAQAELTGNLKFMSLGTLLSINCNEQQTVRIVIENSHSSGEIFIENGNIVHAEIDSEIGEAAFHKIFAIKEGTFSSYLDEKSTQKSITRNWSRLLLDAARQQDEAANVDTPAVDWSQFDLADLGVETIAIEDTVQLNEKHQLIINALKPFNEVLAVAFLTQDLNVLGGQAVPAAEEWLQDLRALLALSEKLKEMLGSKDFSHIQIRNIHNIFVIHQDSYFIYFLIKKDVVPEVLLKEIFIILKRYR